MSDRPQTSDEAAATDDVASRAAELAARFAAGDLDEPGMRELYLMLRAPGPAGRDAAEVAWDVLGSTTDLRSALGTTFQDTVRHRLDAVVAGAGAGGFVDGVKTKLGIERPSLRAIAPSSRSAHDRPATAIPLVGAVVAGVIVIVVALALALATGGEVREIVADVVWAKAPVSVAARPVTTGAHLDRTSRVVVGPEGRLVIAWPSGDRATIHGPATVVPQGGGLSLASGTAWFETGPFTLGLPDGGQAIALGEAKFTAQVQGEVSTLGVASGELLLKKTREDPGTKLEAGFASSGPDKQYEWETEPHWTTTHTGSRLLVCDTERVAWHFRARVVLSSLDDAVVFQGLTGAPAVGVQAGSLILRDAPAGIGEAMERTATGGRRLLGQRIPLKGAPLVERTVELDAAPAQHPRLTITGLESAPEGLTIKIGCPFEVMLYGGGRLEAIQFHVGPPPAPGE